MKSLAVGPFALPNPVLLAPMSGVTDAPFRRLAASLGAGLVISEMTACAALAGEGRAAQQRMARRRVEDHGAGLHVVQIAGCEAQWMAEGARIAVQAGADVVEKWAGRVIPLASGAIGAALNYWFVRAWGERAKAHFRGRYLNVRDKMRSADFTESRMLPSPAVSI